MTKVLMRVNIPVFEYPVSGFRKFSLQKIKFDLKENESIGILGESGGGKSTLLKLLSGLMPSVKNDQICFSYEDGRLSSIKNINRKQRYSRLQIVFQDNVGSLYENETIGTAINHIAKIKGFKRSNRSKVVSQGKIFLQELGLIKNETEKDKQIDSFNSFKKKKVSKLSMGMLRRFCLVKALLLLDIYSEQDKNIPKVLLLDEISRGLDESTKQNLINFLKKIRTEFNLSFIAISHEIDFIKSICEKFIFLFEGFQIPAFYSLEDIEDKSLKSIVNPYIRRYFIPCREPELPEKHTKKYKDWQQYIKKGTPCIFLRHYDCPEKKLQQCVNNGKEYPWICV
ncbi:hypothetical protein GMMP15_1400004 [Candidatus Magnetomoraceae bacterium gMMP-15]